MSARITSRVVKPGVYPLNRAGDGSQDDGKFGETRFNSGQTL
jgi:hypothetical protein